MIRLFTLTEAPSETEPSICFGGLPVVGSGQPFDWPKCKTCGGPMQFLGRLPVPVEQPQRLALVFMCQNDPGMCEEWDANSGGNAVILTDIVALIPVESPENAELVLGGRIGATTTLEESDDYYEAAKVWAAKAHRPQSEVLGHAGDSPDWLQGDETPSCSCCGRPMRFIAQLEEPPYETGCSMNFGGGGSAYLFACPGGGATAKFLWQC